MTHNSGRPPTKTLITRPPRRRAIQAALTSSCITTSAADAGSAGVGSLLLGSKLKPIEIIMACEAGRISIGEWS
jgi:hypothetical protein